MQTKLAPQFKGTPDGDEAEAILRKCVHCGFCTATCPTYQVLGDELDGPRGRIYLIKQALEGQPVTGATQLHLDRCLTCRNCESTCPSGVQYGRLVEIGRAVVDAQVERTPRDKAARWLLKEGLTSPLFKPAVKLGQAVKGMLPPVLADKLPAQAPPQAHDWPTRPHPRKVLLLTGCVQPALMPNINSATARVLDAAGIQTLVADRAGCCGAMRTHLGDREGGLADMRRNIDAWWAVLQSQERTQPIEAIVMNASGCGTLVKDYAHAFRDDPAYADKAKRISELTRDLSELLPELVPKLKPRLRKLRDKTLAYHAPCTLQHGQQLRGTVETQLGELGFEVKVPMLESHLCCGSAGAYSVLQPEMAHTLRERKLSHLEPLQAQAIVSANIGCIQHLQAGTATPVKHWVEALDEALGRL